MKKKKHHINFEKLENSNLIKLAVANTSCYEFIVLARKEKDACTENLLVMLLYHLLFSFFPL